MDKLKVVERHNPRIAGVEPKAPLSVGNGDFGFSVDFTGLQTFAEHYEAPISTQSNWGWHSTHGKDYYTDQDIRYQSFKTYGREVPYPMKAEDKEEAYHWLRQNPHRLQLGRVSLQLYTEEGQKIELQQISKINQVHELSKGLIRSQFLVDDTPVEVQTVCHPTEDIIAVHIVSPLIKKGQLQVSTVFPNPNMTHKSWDQTIQLHYEKEDQHKSSLLRAESHAATVKREMDDDHYQVKWTWSSGSIQQTAEHEFILQPKKEEQFSFTISFSKDDPSTCSFQEVCQESKDYWQTFWLTGGCIDFSGSKDRRAHELERRIVLSQYLCAIHSGGSLPPQETGYMYNSWFGKAHLEMHWWHASHFPLWGRADLLERSMSWYIKMKEKGEELASSQGYTGIRWPKMVAHTGQQTPSPVAPGLIWQQVHPIALAELLYRAKASKDILKQYKEIIYKSADFLVSFAKWDDEKEVYVLGPPLIPAQECHRMEDSLNPPYELEYWKYGLEIAIEWAKRLKEEGNSLWSQVANSLAPLPQNKGVYLAHENCPTTFEEKNHDHPSMLGALGILPGTMVDRDVMLNTLKKVKSDWNWETAWGWDFPMCAMTAARLGEAEMAIDFLMMNQTKNTYLINGHNYQRPGLYAYLPGNGGLLTAVALLLYSVNKDGIRGFPQDYWKVQYEDIQNLL
ncbi:hypothetical protein BTS2_0142 [Bacillus sp. TS-2]|nr:hypothetical protein BTS2_0142 [Bacillus sp. TS-2]